MKHSLQRLSFSLVALSLLLGAGTAQAQEAEQLGGPYEVDENTMLLMHFDEGEFSEGDSTIVNASDSSADGQGNGRLSYVQDPFLQDLGLDRHLDINNSLDEYNSFVEIVDDTTVANSALDLTENWTVETWVQVRTFAGSEGHRRQPRIINKPGTPWYQANFWLYARGEESGDNNFWTGYREDVGDSDYIDLISPPNSLVTAEWRHFALIQDAERGFLIQVISEPIDTDGDGAADELELRHFNTTDIDPIDQSPATLSDKSLFIGQASNNTSDYYLDGFVDEVRISDIVRPFELPPLLRGVTQYDNPTAQEGPYTIEAEASTLLGRSEVDGLTLHYRPDTTGSFTTTPMSSTGEEDTYSAEIPAQEVGAQVQYYVTADQGNKRSFQPSQADDSENPVYYGFTVTGAIEAQTLAFELTFEGGSGIPQDQSRYGIELDTVGNPTYSSETYAGGGSNSLYLDGDSTYVLTDDERYNLSFDSMRVEMWFQPGVDSFQTSLTRLIHKPSGTWFQPNYQIYFDANNDLTAGSYFPDADFGGNAGYLNDFMATTSDSTLTPGSWYQVIYEVSSDSALYRVKNSEGGMVTDTTVWLQGTTPTEGTGATKIGFADGRFFFRGRLDDIKIYNYPRVLGQATPVEGALDAPERVTLAKSYPNPVRKTATIAYELPQAGKVSLHVYDLLGRRVRTLTDGQHSAGKHEVRFEASELPSGVYFYRLETDETMRTRRMVVVN